MGGSKGSVFAWNGPGITATNALQPGATYDFSIYAKLKEGTAASADGSAVVELMVIEENT